MEGPLAGRSDVGKHPPSARALIRVQVDVLRPENVFDSTENVRLTVAGVHDGVRLDVRANKVGRSAMRIDVVPLRPGSRLRYTMIRVFLA